MEFDIFFNMDKNAIRENWMVNAAINQSSGFKAWFENKFLKYEGKPEMEDIVNLIDSMGHVLKYESQPKEQIE